MKQVVSDDTHDAIILLPVKRCSNPQCEKVDYERLILCEKVDYERVIQPQMTHTDL